MRKRDRKNGVPETVTSIPLVDPHAMPENPSIGDLVKDATAQVSTLVRAEVELAKAEITRDVKKGLTGSVFFIVALVVLLYSTFFMFFFLAELLDLWLWRWAAFLVVFILMLVVTAVFAYLGYRKVRRIRGPQQTIESVKETTAALTPGLAKFTGSPAPSPATATPAPSPALERSRTATPAPALRRESIPPRATATATAAAYETPSYSTTPEYTEADYAEADYAEADHTEADHTEARYAEARYAEAPYSEVEYTEPEYADHDYPTEAVVYEEHVAHPGTDDPTAAIYSDTRRPVTRDDDPLPGDPSGW